jgi:hypothetical protein
MDVELKRIEGIAVLDLTARLSDEASENVDALLPRRARCAGFPAGICLKPSSKTALLAKRRAEFPGVWSSSSGVAGASPPAELAHASRGRNPRSRREIGCGTGLVCRTGRLGYPVGFDVRLRNMPMVIEEGR